MKGAVAGRKYHYPAEASSRSGHTIRPVRTFWESLVLKKSSRRRSTRSTPAESNRRAAYSVVNFPEGIFIPLLLRCGRFLRKGLGFFEKFYKKAAKSFFSYLSLYISEVDGFWSLVTPFVHFFIKILEFGIYDMNQDPLQHLIQPRKMQALREQNRDYSLLISALHFCN